MNVHPSEDVYKLAVRIAVVAGAFSLIVCALLLYDYSRRPACDPGDSPALVGMKKALVAMPDDEDLRARFQELDRQLRHEQFRQLAFTTVGVWLLLGGAGVFLLSATWAASIRRKLPQPVPRASQVDQEEATTQAGRWAVAGVLLLAVVTAVGLGTAMQYDLPTPGEHTAAIPNGDPNGKTNGDPVVPPKPELPMPKAPADAEELARSWPRFRGTGGQGISAFTNLPKKWDGESGKNILWKTTVPLPGNNSPVVCRGRVFLSGADEKQRVVYCFDADTGKILWQREVPGTPESETKFKVMDITGFAASTMVTDGYRVFVIFANGDVAALDYAGEVVWNRSLGIPENDYGHASSLTMFENRLLVQMDQGSHKDDKSKLRALDIANGETLWEVVRKVPPSWSTPIVIDSGGRRQVITATSPWVFSNDPTDGKELWRADCLSQDVGPSPAYHGGKVYAVNEYPGLSAIAADGSGDVTETHVKWEGEDGLPDTACPLATEKYVFLLASFGTLTCYNAEDGEMLWEQDFDATFTSSPSLVGNQLYLFGQEGEVWIVEPGDEGCKTIAESKMGEECVTSPALLEGRIFIRGKKHLFCIGEK